MGWLSKSGDAHSGMTSPEECGDQSPLLPTIPSAASIGEKNEANTESKMAPLLKTVLDGSDDRLWLVCRERGSEPVVVDGATGSEHAVACKLRRTCHCGHHRAVPSAASRR